MSLSYDDLRSGYIAVWAEMISEEELDRSLERQRSVADDDPMHWPMAELLRKRRKIDDYQKAAITTIGASVPAKDFLKECVRRGIIRESTIERRKQAIIAAGGVGRPVEIADRLIQQGRVGETQAAEVLKDLCEPQVRKFIVAPRSLQLLWQTGDREPEDIEAVGDDRPMHEKVDGVVKSRRWDIWAAVGVMGVVVLVLLAKALRERWASDRTARGTEDAMATLSNEPSDWVRKLDHPDVSVRSAALKRLVKQRARAVVALTQALGGQNASRVRGAAWALGQPGNDDAAPALAGLLKHRDWTIRYAAVEALGRIGEPKSLEAVAKLLGAAPDANARVRSAAAKVLGESGDSRYLSVLEPLVKDADAEVAKHARDAVARLSGEGGDKEMEE